MADPSLEVLVAVFDDQDRAERADRALSAAQAEGLIDLLAVAVIARDPEGRIGWRIRGPEPGHLSARAETIATMPASCSRPVSSCRGSPRRWTTTRRAATPARVRRGLYVRGGGGRPPGGAVFIAVIDDRWVTEIGRCLRGYHRLTRRRV